MKAFVGIVKGTPKVVTAHRNAAFVRSVTTVLILYGRWVVTA